ncbi:ABC transporter ATP-binding protein [Microbulbifer agarilyticus]|uniref:ABC transporter ATP-binding protein n=1 Tax=Microbulbifer agarilyticus TaxID=260552 RepID=UPI001CD7E2CC|nr:ABC transporter ATP-binding protein [Microbulbifer agarilyticus]MCA0893714.1 ABC transporter ATP-binding protein [Microbulbifer agarilyticus]
MENISLNYREGINLLSRGSKQALKNLTLEINSGENVGILGRNGAGKSTLLKLLAGIYKHDKGKIYKSKDLRVSFIGLQGGFVPYMSGIENATLTGLLMGMSKREVEEKLESIIAFSELEEAIDKPIFTYSAGMRARLAFAVSVFSEPDLLLIDEAMSVGDSRFRQKSKEKILEMINGDAAVVLVSHEPGLIKSLCKKAVWFEQGEVIDQGDCLPVVRRYSETNQKTSAAELEGVAI